MIDQETKVKFPFLWGKSIFKKSHWAQINLIVGPNGSGKTLLAESLGKQFEENGYNIAFIRSDRKSTDADLQFRILKENEKVRSRIEKVLSSMFGKSIRFIEDIDGSLIPIVANKAWNVEYMLEEVECHGLKEIISLLISLYYGAGNEDLPQKKAESKGEVLFFDEPELHLHPQFQTFFMNEIRRVAAHSSRRIFFLISHSPFFIDLRTPEDLIGVVVCHVNKVPTYIEYLSEKDDDLFRRFLPRFNTYHKQFFFSDNQIFVEGYTDQQMFSSLLPFISEDYSTAGTGIIDVGGKDELGVFCKVCSLLGTDGRIITDLDSLFSGKLREVFCQDLRTKNWLEKQKEKQLNFYSVIFTEKEINQGITLEKLIYRLEKYLTETGKILTSGKIKVTADIKPLIEKLKYLNEKHSNAENVDTYKTVVLQGVNRLQPELEKLLPSENASYLPVIKNLFSLILAAAEASKVYILPEGCIEHYYTQTKILYMPVSGKDRLFHAENQFIQNAHKKAVLRNYSGLIEILKKASARSGI